MAHILSPATRGRGAEPELIEGEAERGQCRPALAKAARAMTEPPSRPTFGRHRKIMPFEPGGSNEDTLRRAAREKAAALNQHALGYGAVAEAEWRAAGIADPDLAAMRRYRLDRIRAELERRDYAGALLYDPVNIRYATELDQHAALGRPQPYPPLLCRH